MIFRLIVCFTVVFICLLTTFFCRHAYVDVARAVDWKGSAYWLKFYFISCMHIMPGMIGMAISLRRSQARFWLWSAPTIIVALTTLMLWREPSPLELGSGPLLSSELFHFSENPFVLLNPLYYVQQVRLFNLRQTASFVFFAIAFLDILTGSASHASNTSDSGTEPRHVPNSPVSRESEL